MSDKIIHTCSNIKHRSKIIISYYRYGYTIQFDGSMLLLFDKQNIRFFINTVSLDMLDYSIYKNTRPFNKYIYFFYRGININQHRNIVVKYDVLSRIREISSVGYKPILISQEEEEKKKEEKKKNKDKEEISKNDSSVSTEVSDSVKTDVGTGDNTHTSKYLDIRKKDTRREIRKHKEDGLLFLFFFLSETFPYTAVNSTRKSHFNSNIKKCDFIFYDNFFYSFFLLEKKTWVSQGYKICSVIKYFHTNIFYSIFYNL